MKLIYDGPKDGPLFVFAHGAGAPADSVFMETVAKGLADHGIGVIRFNFPYMQQRVDGGSRRPPERADKLIAQYEQLIAEIAKPMVIGGKSMGGRIASLVCAQSSENINTYIKGVACLGFPFHPAAKPEKLRTEHFPIINCETLIIQGDRDKLGSKEEVEGYGLPESIEWLWLPDGDHDLKPRVKSGFTHQQHLQGAIKRLAVFVQKHAIPVTNQNNLFSR